MPASKKPFISHLGLFVADIQQMQAFYTGIIELQVTDEGPFTGGKYRCFKSRDERLTSIQSIVKGE